MKLYKMSDDTNIKECLKDLEVTPEGAKILCKKSKYYLIYIKDLRAPAANILKQDALSIGADLAVPKNSVTCQDPLVDAVLIANENHINQLAKKEKIQPFGLKELASRLPEFLHHKKDKTQIMGVLNANHDSFNANSRFSDYDAQMRIETMMAEGADIIDIGGLSSRPGSTPISDEAEWERIKNIVDIIEKNKFYDQVLFSLDSYSPLCLRYALDRGFSIINDITALENDEVAKIASAYDATVVLMHKRGTPKQMQDNPQYDNVILDVDAFFDERVQKARAFGVQKIVLDVGIGFGKTLEHNLSLLQHHEHFLHFGYPLLIGASRKSMINAISTSEVAERLPGTLAIHLEAVRKGASIVRAHDVKEHQQALRVQDAILEAQ
ncbi:dihydropteroate synthase [Sulfurospirillum sp. 1612]|uniref:dihydropteroate synthase n=1 Tax=Sulfurospirillum sp. 1612 TaxID=3094835 RepID=UPI002F957640